VEPLDHELLASTRTILYAPVGQTSRIDVAAATAVAVTFAARPGSWDQ
jgi:hypothetical protein